MMNRRSFLALAAAATIAPAFQCFAEDAKPAHKNVTPDEFEKLSKEPNTVILDVRTPTEYAAGHIKGSIPMSFTAKDFNEKIKQLDRNKTYLVHCASGTRSAKACGKLDALDFPRVYNLLGGINAWKEAGKPVEK
jgi:rhodanese-related sulfurtransferase